MPARGERLLERLDDIADHVQLKTDDEARALLRRFEKECRAEALKDEAQRCDVQAESEDSMDAAVLRAIGNRLRRRAEEEAER